MINSADMYRLLPQMIMAGASLLVMICMAIKRSHLFCYLLTLLCFLAAFISLFYIRVGSVEITALFVMDGFGLFFTGLILCGGFVVTLLSYHYLEQQEINKEEYYILLLLATFGSLMMVISNHFLSFFLSLEVLSIGLYALIGYLKKRETVIEAGIKYLVLAAVSASFLLFGVALIYASTGHLDLSGMRAVFSNTMAKSAWFMGGLAMVSVGIGFKLALVPFHLWTSDVYAGAPAPVSAFVATVSKGAVLVFLFRLFDDLSTVGVKDIRVVFGVLAVASMLIGNWLALKQQNIKKMLAYSSIAHLGYLMVALLSFSQTGIRAVMFYMAAYFVSMLGSFGVIIFLSKDTEADQIADYRGLFWKRPWLAAFFATALLSLAGIPLTAGFIGKLYVIVSGAGSGMWWLLIVLIVSSTLGLFYYLGVVATMFSRKRESMLEPAQRVPFSLVITLAVLFFLLLWLGIFPSALLQVIDQLVVILH